MPVLASLCAAALVLLAACQDPPPADTSPPEAPIESVDSVSGPAIAFLEATSIGEAKLDPPPWITNVRIVDLDQDGLLDVVACDGKENQVLWIRQSSPGTFREQVLDSSIFAPAHVTPSDIDDDGDLDLLVAEMGIINPNNAKIGAVVVLENDGQQRFTSRVLVDSIARVTDVEPGDFDGDGDLDLAVAQFGYHDGEIRWMENEGDWRFKSHQLLDLEGTIHTPVADMDSDGDLDIVALVSQDWEEIYVFANDGAGGFERERVFASTNPDFGSSGISLADLDQDGDLDILYTNGDAFDYEPPAPRPWHGVQWLENEGGLGFTYRRLGEFPGAFSAVAVDADRDGDLDVFAVSLFNRWGSANASSMIWFENDGESKFTVREIARAPTHLVSLDHGDMDGDGWVDFVTGGMNAYPPFDSIGRVTLWTNGWSRRERR